MSMKEKLNLTSLTKMTKKELLDTKGGLFCHCFCYIYPEYDKIESTLAYRIK